MKQNIFMKFIKPSWMSMTAVATALAPWKALAQTTGDPFQRAIGDVTAAQDKAGLGATVKTLPEIIGSVINVLLGFLGIIFLVLMLWAGFLWMTARGEEGPVEKAQLMIRQAVIGLVVVIAAFAISNYVLTSLVNVTK